MNQPTSNNLPKQNIILDTNILFYLGDNNIKRELLNYLLELIRVGFGLAISKITITEIFSGIPRQKEQEASNILNVFIKYDIDDNVVITTSKISTIYKNCKDINTNQIDLADRIISSTAILTGSLIMTANINDFPRPFFSEKHEKIFFYKNKNKTNMRVIQLLQPNLLILNDRFFSRP
jgi:predicted nucleic acid-binding protein